LEDFEEVFLLVAEHLGEGGGTGAGLDVGLLADLVAGEEKLEGGGGAEPEALAGGVFGGDDDGAKGGGIGEAFEALEDGVEGHQLIFQLAGVEEIFEDFVAAGDGFLVKDDGLGLFCREGEVAIFPEGFLCAVPPAFPLGVVEDLGHEGLGDLVLGGFAAKAVEDGAHHGDGVFLGPGFEGGEIGGLEGEDVVGGDGLEGLGSVLELHGVAFFRSKVDGQLADEEVDGVDATEAPAFVVAIAAGEKFIQRMAGLGGEFAAVNGFLDFCIHRIEPVKIREASGLGHGKNSRGCLCGCGLEGIGPLRGV